MNNPYSNCPICSASLSKISYTNFFALDGNIVYQCSFEQNHKFYRVANPIGNVEKLYYNKNAGENTFESEAVYQWLNNKWTKID